MLKILMIEDDLELAAILSEYLESRALYGYECLEYSSF